MSCKNTLHVACIRDTNASVYSAMRGLATSSLRRPLRFRMQPRDHVMEYVSSPMRLKIGPRRGESRTYVQTEEDQDEEENERRRGGRKEEKQEEKEEEEEEERSSCGLSERRPRPPEVSDDSHRRVANRVAKRLPGFLTLNLPLRFCGPRAHRSTVCARRSLVFLLGLLAFSPAA